jgi:glycosyltransferase involved in cell wall biosynthesis
MDPLVSVIIPNYNHADFLQERLESIVNQTYANFEIIILDDASTDLSKIIIEQYRNNFKIAHIVYNSENSGSPFLQWKKGIALARAKYIWIAESDDISRLDFLETLVPILEKDPELMLVYSDSEREYFDWIENQQDTNRETEVFEGKEFIQQKMLTSPVIVNASAVLFRREAVQETILLESCNYKSAFDWLFWCSFALRGNVAFCPIKLNFFRKHLQSTSLKSTKQGLFITEGLQVNFYLKKNHKIKLNLEQCLIWSSVWAQTCLLFNKKRRLFLQSYKQAWSVSPQLLIFFFYYLIKFRFFCPTNINTTPKA